MNVDKVAVLKKLEALPDEYWIKVFREIEAKRQNKVEDLLSEFIYLFDMVREQVLDLIEEYYLKYQQDGMVDYNTGRTRLNQHELAELNKYLTDIENDLKARGLEFDKDLAKKIKGVNTRTTRIEALKLKIECKLFYLYSVIGLDTYNHLSTVTDDFYSETIFEVFYAAGYGTNDITNLDEEALAVILTKVWRASQETFDDTIWRYGRELSFAVNNMIGRGSFAEADFDLVLAETEKLFPSKLRDIKALLRTDSTFYSTLGQEDAFKELYIEEAVFTAVLDERTTEWCQEANGNVIPVDDIVPWENAPPLHYNCRSTMIPVVKQLDWLTGDVYEVDSHNFDDWYDTHFE